MTTEATAHQLSLHQAETPFATCPFSVGDKVYLTEKKIAQSKGSRLISENTNIVTLEVPQREHRKAHVEGRAKTITDIVCVQHLEGGGSEFCYSLDGSSIYAPIQVE